jgi:hypothetical protein
VNNLGKTNIKNSPTKVNTMYFFLSIPSFNSHIPSVTKYSPLISDNKKISAIHVLLSLKYYHRIVIPSLTLLLFTSIETSPFPSSSSKKIGPAAADLLLYLLKKCSP